MYKKCYVDKMSVELLNYHISLINLHLIFSNFVYIDTLMRWIISIPENIPVSETCISTTKTTLTLKGVVMCQQK